MTGLQVSNHGGGVEETLRTHPQIVELYPLDRFLQALLTRLESLVDQTPVACYVPVSRVLAARATGRCPMETVSVETDSTLLTAAERGVVSGRSLGSGIASLALAPVDSYSVLPCKIITRPLGFLLIPSHSHTSDLLPSLADLAGYYLHRHEIELAIRARSGRALVIMGSSPQMFRIQEDVERYARPAEPVLITGESGSGKEIFAQAIHVLSPRRSGPFVSVNCGSSPSETMLLDEFFGHRRGAFTGAMFDKEGRCQEADGGTLFLDEIGEMSHELQTLLLRTLTTGEVRRVGDQRSERVDIRLVSATHKDLLRGTQDKSFRSDLYYRISAFQLRIPPLRERQGDIRSLAEYIVYQFAFNNGLASKQLSDAALRRLESHSWPGNVRELENVLKRAFVLATGDLIDAVDIQLDLVEAHAIDNADRLLLEIRHHGHSFWDVVYKPFMQRDLTRSDVALLLEKSRLRSGARLKQMATYFQITSLDYPKFVAFLHRHGFRWQKESDEGEKEE